MGYQAGPQKMSVVSKAKGVLLLLRPSYALFAALWVWAGMFFVERDFELSPHYVLPPLIMFLHYMGACVKDDIEDRDIDRLIDPSRPLVVGSVSLGAATAIWILLHAIALVPAYVFVNTAFFLTTIVYVGVGVWAYTTEPLRLSDRGFLGSAFFSLSTIAMPFFTGVIASRGVTMQAVLLALMLWVWAFSIDVLKDFFKEESNKKEKRRTFVLTSGATKAGKLYGLLMLSVVLLVPIAYYAFPLNLGFALFMGGVGLWMAVLGALLASNPVRTLGLSRITYYVAPVLMWFSLAVGMYRA